MYLYTARVQNDVDHNIFTIKLSAHCTAADAAKTSPVENRVFWEPKIHISKNDEPGERGCFKTYFPPRPSFISPGVS